jgi:hypothetical protein
MSTSPLNMRRFLEYFGARSHSVTKGLYGRWVGVCAVLAGSAVVALGLALVIPALWAFSVTLALGSLVLITLVGLAMLSRLSGHLFDASANISLQGHLSRSGFAAPNFFVDGAAASATLQLLVVKALAVCRPRSILELGSGQSTKVLGHYAASHPDADILTLEEDAQFHSLFSGQWQRPTNHVYHLSPLVTVDVQVHGDTIPASWYGDRHRLLGRTFDLILIDGPTDSKVGTESVRYGRSGVLSVLPAILADRFVIILDDTDNYGYALTAQAIYQRVRKDRPACCFQVHGVKSHTVICSPEWRSLQSM